MKQITFKELKEICGCETNNEFANMLSLCMDYAAKHNINGRYEVSGELYRKKEIIFMQN